MADASSNFAAYRQLTPLKGDVTDDLQGQEDLALRKRAEQREKDRIKAIEQEKKDKKRQEVLASIKPQDLYDTGSESMNELLYKGVQKAYNKWDDILPVLLNPNNYSDKEVVKANLVASNLNSFTEKTAMLDKALREVNESYQQDRAAGKIWEDPKFEKDFKEGFRNKSLGVNDLGEPILYFIDEDGDGLDDNTGRPGKIGDFISYSDIANGTGLDKYNFEKRYNFEGTLNDLSKQIQPVVNKNIVGGKYITTTGLDETALEQRVSSTLTNSDGTPTEILKSFSKEFNIDLNNPKKVEEFKNSMKEALRLRAKGGKQEEYITNPIEWERLNMQKNKDAKEEEKNQVSFNLVEVPPAIKTAGVKPAEGYKAVSVSNSKPIPYIQGVAGGKKQTFTNAQLNSYTVVKNKLGQRSIVAEIVYQDSKGSTLSTNDMMLLDSPQTPQSEKDLILSRVTKGAENKNAVVNLSEADAEKFRKQMKFKDVNEMKTAAKAGDEDDARPKTVVQNGVTYTWNEATKTYE